MMGLLVVDLLSNIALTRAGLYPARRDGHIYAVPVCMTTIASSSTLATGRGIAPTSTAGLRFFSRFSPEGNRHVCVHAEGYSLGRTESHDERTGCR